MYNIIRINKLCMHFFLLYIVVVVIHFKSVLFDLVKNILASSSL